MRAPFPLTTPLEYVVERDGREQAVSGPYPYPPIVLHLAPKSAAYGAGLEVGDVITGIDGRAICRVLRAERSG